VDSPDTRLRVAVLGPVLVEGARGEMIEPPGATAKGLVAALVLARGPLSVRGIVDDVWADAAPRNEKAALHTVVSRLRSVCADDLVGSVSGGYVLAIAADQCDLGRATALRDRARAASADGRWEDALAATRTALSFWRGEPGSGLGESELAERLADTAGRLHDELLRLHTSARVELGDVDAALADLESQLTQHPLDEELELLRLRALAAAGRRTEAVRLFAEFRGRLRETLGTNPSPALVELNATLLRESDAATATARVAVGLRTAPNELVGRSEDVVAVESLMHQARLTTILGAGGLGKTRLAQEIAARASERVPAVYVVELAGARSGDDVPFVLATTLGIRELTGARLKLSDPGVRVDVRTRVLAALRERPTLLVLDNCEHLVDAVAQWAADILDGTTQVRLLATSRAPLMIAAESVYQLDSLTSASTGAEPAPAVRLFLERARSARPSVVLPLETVAHLCDRLDGLPLAIELAAARVRSMSVEEIERRIGNRFALLRGGDRTAPERHRTLLAVIEWSWDLLTEAQRRTLRRLSRFVDGFSAEAAQRVAAGADHADIGDDLEALVNQSLITVSENENTGALRYRMLETVREFGDLELASADETERVQDATLGWAADFGARMAEEDFGPQQVAAFRRVDVEQENLVAALRTAIELRRGDVIVAIFACLGYHWSLRGAHSEVYALADSVVAALTDYEPDDAQLNATVVSYALIAGTLFYGSARGWVRPLGRLRKLMRTRRPRDERTAALADLLLSVNDPEKTARLIARLQKSDDPGTAAFGHLIGAQLLENGGDTTGSLEASRVGYEAAIAARDTWSEGMAAQSLAQLYSQTAQPRAALEWAQRARPLLASLQASDDLRQLDWLVAINQIAIGDTASARPTLEFLVRADADEIGFDYTDLRAIGFAGLGELAMVEGHEQTAIELFRAGAAVFDQTRTPGAPWFHAIGAGAIAVAVRAGLADDPHTVTDVRKLRLRLLVSRRSRPKNIDHPITGTGLLGLAIWLLAPDRSTAGDRDVELGIELLALAHGLSSRQDFPATNWQRAADEATSTHGDAALSHALARVDALDMDARTDRAFELIRAVRLPTAKAADAADPASAGITDDST